MNKLDQFEKLPTSMLTDVTTPIQPGTNGNGGTGFVSDTDALKGAEHTKISPISIPTGDNAGNPPQNASGNVYGAGSSVTLGSMIDGKLAIELMDALLPALLVAALHSVKITMRKSELQLTESEKKTIVPIFHECLKTVHLNFNNPWVALSVTVGVIYGSKITEKGIIAWIDQRNEQAELAASEVHTTNHVPPPGQSSPQMSVTPAAVQQSANGSTYNTKRPSTEAEKFKIAIAETFLEKGLTPVELSFPENVIKAKVARLRISRLEAVKKLTLEYIKKKK